jgi:hypothetical protein
VNKYEEEKEERDDRCSHSNGRLCYLYHRSVVGLIIGASQFTHINL